MPETPGQDSTQQQWAQGPGPQQPSQPQWAPGPVPPQPWNTWPAAPQQGPFNPYPPSGYGVAAPYSAMAIIGFISAFFIAPLGIILSIVARVRIRRTGMRGGGLAVGGIIAGSICFVFQSFVIVLLIGVAVMNLTLVSTVKNSVGSAGDGSSSSDASWASLPPGASGLPTGFYQHLTSDDGWSATDGTPTAAYQPRTDQFSSYASADGSCMISFGAGTAAKDTAPDATVQQISTDAIKQLLDAPASKESGQTSATRKGAPQSTDVPVFTAAGTSLGTVGAEAASFVDNSGRPGWGYTRLFRSNGSYVTVAGLVACTSQNDLDAIGKPALTDIGPAW